MTHFSSAYDNDTKICMSCGVKVDNKPITEKTLCPQCGEVMAKGSNKVIGFYNGSTGLAKLFLIFAALSMLGGFLLMIISWSPPYQILSLIWLFAGLLEAALFTAIAQILNYLNGIHQNTLPLKNIKKKKTTNSNG